MLDPDSEGIIQSAVAVLKCVGDCFFDGKAYCEHGAGTKPTLLGLIEKIFDQGSDRLAVMREVHGSCALNVGVGVVHLVRRA